MSVLKRVISGGQTGADLAGLCAAKVVGLETGGTAPLGFKTLNGSDPSLATSYGLVESRSSSYPVRSKLNVDNSDATIAFRLRPSVGTDKTIGYCATQQWRAIPLPAARFMHRPCLVIDNLRDELDAVARIVEFVRKERPATLNICGHRGSDTAGMSDFEIAVQFILVSAFRELKDAQ